VTTRCAHSRLLEGIAEHDRAAVRSKYTGRPDVVAVHVVTAEQPRKPFRLKVQL